MFHGPVPCPDDEEDYEAKDAMMSLLRAEEIKDSDEDFLARVSEQVDKKMDLLERIRGMLPQVLTLMPGEPEDEGDGDPAKGSRTFEDFLSRIRKKETVEEFKSQEDPKARRIRRELRNIS